MLCGHDGSRGFALKAVEQQGLFLTELELGLQVGATLIAIIIRMTHRSHRLQLDDAQYVRQD